mgnify:CR=1 FL=1
MSRAERSRYVTIRAVIIGILIMPVNLYWIIIAKEPYYYQSVPISFALLYNVVFIMSVLVFINSLLRRFFRKGTLSQGELLTIHVILCFTTTVGGMDMMQILPCVMEHAFGFATPENEWENLFHRYIPEWLSVRDQSVLEPYYNGDSSFYNPKYIYAWLKPALVWSSFVFALVFVMLCVNVIMRKSWVEQSKLSFPIIQLPLEMTRERFSIFRNHLTWIGIAISGGIALINGLHMIYPVIPHLRILPNYHNMGMYFHNEPWSAIGWTPVGMIPSIVGLSFFMPLDLSFSCWFFYLFWKAQRILFSVIGTKAMASVTSHNIAFLNQQTFGAVMGIAVISLWLSRHHFKKLVKSLFEGRSRSYDSDEPMKYGNAILGLIAGGAFLLFFSWSAGMAPWVAVAFFIFYYAFALTIAKLRAELGTPVHDFHATGPDQIMAEALGTRTLGTRSLTIFSLYHFFNRTYRSHPMPHPAEGFKIASQTGMDPKRLFRAMVVALVIGVPVFFWVYLHVSYKYQGSMVMRFAAWSYRRLESQLVYPHTFDPIAIMSIAAGFVITLVLMFLRMRFIWWTLHPAGYAISSSFSMNVCWSSIFMSWLLKYMILRSGGFRILERARPFFCGLILGQFIMAGFWSILGIAMKRTIYIFTW